MTLGWQEEQARGRVQSQGSPRLRFRLPSYHSGLLSE